MIQKKGTVDTYYFMTHELDTLFTGIMLHHTHLSLVMLTYFIFI